MTLLAWRPTKFIHTGLYIQTAEPRDFFAREVFVDSYNQGRSVEVRSYMCKIEFFKVWPVKNYRYRNKLQTVLAIGSLK